MSIHPQSSSDTYFIFCVGQSIPIIAAFKTAMVSQGIWFKALMGKYKGQSEYSFIAQMKNYARIGPWLREEESIHHIHSFNSSAEPKATLLYLKDGTEEYLGRMVPVSREEAFTHDSWTFDTTYRNYYVCKMIE
jgi:hypothetical protein